MDDMDFEDMELNDKEKKILNAACSVFAEKGYSAATTSEIAKMAGVAEGTIFRYFKTKKHIMHGLLIQLVHLMADKVAIPPIEKILKNARGKDAKEVIKEVILDRLKLVDKHFPLFKVVASQALFDEEIRSIILEKIVNRVIPAFEETYGRLVEEGRLRPLKSKVALRTIVANIGAFIAYRKLMNDKVSIDSLDKDMDEMIDALLNGIGAKYTSHGNKNNKDAKYEPRHAATLKN